MTGKTHIQWTEKTWNPVVGCSIISPGCKNCYAMKWAGRRMDGNPNAPHYAGTTQPSNAGPVWTGKLSIAPDHIVTAPLRWRKPAMIFVNSMSDLFHENMPTAWIDTVFRVMAMTPHHTYQVLTKRSDRMREYLSDPAVESRIRSKAATWPLHNVWLGVSVEDQARANQRIPDLLATPAACRWISAEPLIGHINLSTAWDGEDALDSECWGECAWCDNNLPPLHNCQKGLQSEALHLKGRSGLDWVVVGGESTGGSKARPMHPEWVRAIRDQCADAGVPFFFKQWGDWAPIKEWEPQSRKIMTAIDIIGEPVPHDVAPEDVGGQRFMMVGKKEAEDYLDGQQHHQWPEAAR